MMASPGPGAVRRDGTSRNFTNVDSASLVNIARLHFRLARRAGERDGQLGATVTPRAAQAGAIELDILRQRWPGQDRRGDVAKAGTAHVLFIRVERLVSNARLAATIGK
jgi:hypothetical protein